MNNPEIQRQYQVYLQQGGTLAFPAYYQRYAETGGFTQQGYQHAMATQAQINAQDAASRNAYHQHSQQLQQSTWEYRNAVQDRWAKERGESLSAQAPYFNSHDGSSRYSSLRRRDQPSPGKAMSQTAPVPSTGAG